MIELGISVSAANILLWAFVEVFVLLMGMRATALVARRHLNHSLLRGEKVTLNGASDLVDKLPYNGDLHPIPQFPKFLLTAFRLLMVAVSIYVGTGLDGELAEDNRPFPVSSSVSVAPFPGDLLTENDGNDVAAMIKLSCLKVINNNNVVLYKGFAGGGDIACQDGLATFETNRLLKFEIRAGLRTPESGLDLTGMNIQESTTENSELVEGIQRSNSALVMNVTDPLDSNQDISTRVVLRERIDEDVCIFGIWRSPGAGFENRVDVILTTKCELQILAMERLLRRKCESLPPRMAFVYQVIDGVLVSNRETEAPRLKGVDITATISVPALVIGGIAAVVSTVVAVVFWLSIRRGVVGADLMTVGGIAELWKGEEGGEGGELVFRWDGGDGSRDGQVVRVCGE